MGLWGRRRGRGRFHSGILVWGALTGDWALWRREVKRCPRRIAPLGVVRRVAPGAAVRAGAPGCVRPVRRSELQLSYNG